MTDVLSFYQLRALEPTSWESFLQLRMEKKRRLNAILLGRLLVGLPLAECMVLLLSTAIAAVAVWFHGPWADEAQAWLSAQGLQILTARKPVACDPDGLVFAARNGSPLCRRNLLNRQLKPTSEKLKLEGVTWHWLRHATATLLDSVGASIGTMQALLGHSSPEITHDVYLHSVPADARQAVPRVEDLIGPKWTQVPVWPEALIDVTQ